MKIYTIIGGVNGVGEITGHPALEQTRRMGMGV